MQTEQLTTEQANQAIEDLLKECGISYTVSLVGETTRDNNWKCDEWRVIIRKDKIEETFRYYTGTGLRAKPTERQKQAAKSGFVGLTENDMKGETSYGKRYLAAVEALRSPVTPHIASVLCSLLSDSGAIDQCFSDWCSDFGYDDDSIKALGVYNACCGIGKQMRKIFTPMQRVTLRDLLQDY